MGELSTWSALVGPQVLGAAERQVSAAGLEVCVPQPHRCPREGGKEASPSTHHHTWGTSKDNQFLHFPSSQMEYEEQIPNRIQLAFELITRLLSHTQTSQYLKLLQGFR